MAALHTMDFYKNYYNGPRATAKDEDPLISTLQYLMERIGTLEEKVAILESEKNQTDLKL